MNESLYTVGREFGLDVAGEESAGFVILLQHGIKMCERESSDEQVGLFAGAEFGNRTHFLSQVIQFWNPRRRGPDRFVQLLDVIHEVHVVGAAENHHAFRGRYSFEDLVHAVDRKADVVVRHQKESRNVAAPLERQLRWQNPRPWIRPSAGRKRHNRPDLMHHAGEASAVQPPKLCPTIPTGAGLSSAWVKTYSRRKLMSGTRLAMAASASAARCSGVSPSRCPSSGATSSE